MFRRLLAVALWVAPAVFCADKSILELQRDVAALQEQVRGLQKSLDEKLADLAQKQADQVRAAAEQSGKSMASIGDRIQKSIQDRQDQESQNSIAMATWLRCRSKSGVCRSHSTRSSRTWRRSRPTRCGPPPSSPASPWLRSATAYRNPSRTGRTRRVKIRSPWRRGCAAGASQGFAEVTRREARGPGAEAGRPGAGRRRAVRQVHGFDRRPHTEIHPGPAGPGESKFDRHGDVAALQEQVRGLQKSLDEKLADLAQKQADQVRAAAEQSGKSMASIGDRIQKSIQDRQDQESQNSIAMAGMGARLQGISSDVGTIKDSLADLNTTLAKLATQITDLANAVKTMQTPVAPPSGQATLAKLATQITDLANAVKT